MFNTQEIIKKAFEELRAIHGEDFKLEDGDIFVFALNNCTLLISQDDGNLNIEFIGNNAIKLNMSCSIYEEDKPTDE